MPRYQVRKPIDTRHVDGTIANAIEVVAWLKTAAPNLAVGYLAHEDEARVSVTNILGTSGCTFPADYWIVADFPSPGELTGFAPPEFAATFEAVE